MVTAELTIDLEPDGFEEPITPTLPPTSNEQVLNLFLLPTVFSAS